MDRNRLHIGGILFLIVLLALLTVTGCGSPEPAVTEEPASEVEPSGDEQSEVEADSPSGAVADLQDVKSAAIQIEAQGTFIDPEFGLQVNAAGRGSGLIIDPSGLAVTNNHVVTGAALIKVFIGGEGEAKNARLIAASECSDLALIDIDGEGYPYLEWYEGDIDVGLDMYIAGFPLGDPEFTLTRGVISKAKANGESNWASVDAVLEYDATSNPGNSGGPVVDENGKVFAVHYAGNASTRQAFGIARDAATQVIDQLKQGEDVDSIGINGTAVVAEDESFSGIWVSSVKSGSPADQTGIEAGDILYTLESLVLATDGTMKDYCDILRTHSPDDTLSLEVVRFASGEILEGQLNGRELVLVDSFETGTGGDTGDTGTGSQPSGEPFFVDEFDYGVDSWSYFLMSGFDEDLDLYTENGKLIFDLNGEDLWSYLTYDEYIYSDVVLSTSAENRGKNTNNVSLICRYTEDGWYEFNIGNDGLYSILVYDATEGEYDLLFNGGSTAIRSGKDVNEYTAVCEGNTLTLYINGVEVRSVTETRYNLQEGLVGLSVSSFSVLPISVEFDWVSITQP